MKFEYRGNSIFTIIIIILLNIAYFKPCNSTSNSKIYNKIFGNLYVNGVASLRNLFLTGNKDEVCLKSNYL